MGDDAIVRIFQKLDEISIQLARTEAKLDEYEKHLRGLEKNIEDHNERIGRLEQAKASAVGAREFIVWLIAAILGVYGVMKP